MTIFRGFILCVFLSFLYGGCSYSIHSNQYQIIKGVFNASNNAQRPNTNSWKLDWSGYQFFVTPVNIGSQTWFVNKEKIVVRFDGWQVTNVENLIAENISVNIKINGDEMLFDANGRNFQSASCSKWTEIPIITDKGRRLTQFCEQNGGSFVNEILIDKGGAIYGLSFKIHPRYANLVLSPA